MRLTTSEDYVLLDDWIPDQAGGASKRLLIENWNCCELYLTMFRNWLEFHFKRRDMQYWIDHVQSIWLIQLRCHMVEVKFGEIVHNILHCSSKICSKSSTTGGLLYMSVMIKYHRRPQMIIKPGGGLCIYGAS